MSPQCTAVSSEHNDGDHHDEEEKDEMKEMNKGEDTDMICTTYTVLHYTATESRLNVLRCHLDNDHDHRHEEDDKDMDNIHWIWNG